MYSTLSLTHVKLVISCKDLLHALETDLFLFLLLHDYDTDSDDKWMNQHQDPFLVLLIGQNKVLTSYPNTYKVQKNTIY